ncbi:MAG: hypothetical protein MH204_10100, partial [Fimbriimonadaceae bacterium]|nr:hypothetical protein [Fimbriimonadaceae bacterium]
VARRLEANGPTAVCRVVGHVNGWAGYMLDSEDYARGGYEATLHFYGPSLADRLVAARRKDQTRESDRMAAEESRKATP